MPDTTNSAEEAVGRLSRENEHLRGRVAQLQGEVWTLNGRLAQALLPPDRAAPIAPLAISRLGDTPAHVRQDQQESGPR